MGGPIITLQEMQATRILFGIDRRQFATLSGKSLPTIQRMEPSDGPFRSVVVLRPVPALTQEIARLDQFDLLIADDLSYIRKDHVVTRALFELISATYERRTIMITANQSFRKCCFWRPNPSSGSLAFLLVTKAA